MGANAVRRSRRAAAKQRAVHFASGSYVQEKTLWSGSEVCSTGFFKYKGSSAERAVRCFQ